MKNISIQGMSPWALGIVTTAMLSACGGGGSSVPTANAVSSNGVAAVGAPIIGGAVTLRCATGATATATTDQDGAWSTGLKDSDFPCMIRVSGGQANGQALAGPLHSIAATPGRANITPLTDLMAGIVSGQKAAIWFESATTANLSGTITTASLATAQDKLKTVLGGLPGKLSLPGDFNPISSPFNAQKGDAGDGLLESYDMALTAVGLTQSDASSLVATGQMLTQEGFAITAVTTPNMTTFRAGAALTRGGDFVLSIPDPNRGTSISQAIIDTAGNLVQVNAPFTAVTSLLSNRIGQLCVAGTGAYGLHRQSQYLYISEGWTPVTDISELHGKVFDEYEDCSLTGTSEFKSDDSFVFTETGESADTPDQGISQAFTGKGLESTTDDTVLRIKAYKLSTNGKTIYAYFEVSTKKDATAPTINGNTDYVVMGVTK